MAKLKFKELDKKVQASEGDQSVHMTVIAQLGKHKLQFKLRSNAYKAQGWANVSRFDGEKWQLVSHIVPSAMATREGLIYRVQRPITNPNTPSPVCSVDFAHDYAELKRQAELILA